MSGYVGQDKTVQRRRVKRRRRSVPYCNKRSRRERKCSIECLMFEICYAGSPPLPSLPPPPLPPPPPYSERHRGSALEGEEPRAGYSEMKSHQSLFETWMTSISNGWYSRWQILEYGSQVALTGSTGATLAAIRV